MRVCGSKAASSLQLSTKEDLPHSSGKHRPSQQSILGRGPQLLSHCQCLGLCHQEQEFQAKLSLKGGEYKRDHNHILFKFFFIFLHTGKSSEGA